MWKRIDLRETSNALSGRRIERADHKGADEWKGGGRQGQQRREGREVTSVVSSSGAVSGRIAGERRAPRDDPPSSGSLTVHQELRSVFYD